MGYLNKIEERFVNKTYKEGKSRKEVLKYYKSVINDFFKFIWSTKKVTDRMPLNEMQFLTYWGKDQLIIDFLNWKNQNSNWTASAVKKKKNLLKRSKLF